MWREISLTLVALANTGAAKIDRLFSDAAFEEGKLGGYPVKEYATSHLVGPVFNYLEYNGKCDRDDLYIMMTPRGFDVDHPGPMVVDSQGSLIWTDDRYQMPYNLMVQKYKGKEYLTFWAGDDGVRGHGSGMYYMLDSAYNETHQIRAANGLDGDLHEFRITEQDTAIITVYHVEPHDLSPIGGSVDGWIWEAIVQEIDIETGDAIFEWRASEHISIEDTFRPLGDDEGTEDNAFDWFHLNSIEKDEHNNYLISSRHLHSLTYIDGSSGKIIWCLGGKSNMFEDLSDGKATSFAWQHDARWRDNHTAISIFDNESMGPAAPEAPSKGLLIDVDMAAMTAKVRRTYRSPKESITLSQGSMQVLPNGNVLLGYGYNAMYTEYSPEGDILCNVHFGPASQFGGGKVQSYRVYKYPWVGKPNTSPIVDAANETLSMSWMGATEIAKWKIEEADRAEADNHEWGISKTIPKDGFETQTSISGVWRRYIRVIALDAHGNVLGTSQPIDSGSDRTPSLAVFGLAIGNMGLITIFVFAYLGAKQWMRYRHYARAPASDTISEMAEVDVEADLDRIV